MVLLIVIERLIVLVIIGYVFKAKFRVEMKHSLHDFELKNTQRDPGMAPEEKWDKKGV